MQEATTSGCESGRSTRLRKICRRLNSRRFEVGQIGSSFPNFNGNTYVCNEESNKWYWRLPNYFNIVSIEQTSLTFMGPV